MPCFYIVLTAAFARSYRPRDACQWQCSQPRAFQHVSVESFYTLAATVGTISPRCRGSSPEALLLRELTACLPAADPVADAWLHLLPGLSLSGPGATHRPLDFWALLVLHAKRPGCQKAVEGLLRKKILDAPTAAAAWIGKAIQDHQVPSHLIA